MEKKIQKEEERFVKIVEYHNKLEGIYFKGTEEEFEEFKKFHGMYPYRPILESNQKSDE